MSELPNIGDVLEKRLEAIGIYTPANLAEVGSLGALQRMDALNNPGCISMLYALEGAIRRIRWHDLPIDIKDQLKTKLKTIQTQETL